MLKRLRWKFIGTAMLASVIVFTVLLVGINMAYRTLSIRNIDMTLQMIASNEGRFPPNMDANMPPRDDFRGLGMPITAETPFETRFFVVWAADEDGNVRKEMRSIASVSDEEAESYYAEAEGRKQDIGFISLFRYRRCESSDGSYIIFLDCTRQIHTFRNILYVSLMVALLALMVTFLLVIILSKKSLAPVARSIESQKRFITDASHELKTPLTVIASHADILCMENENNEWAQGIRRETGRMASLVNDLVLLSRWDEEAPIREKYEFDLSGAIWDTLAPFQKLAEAKSKMIRAEIEESLHFTGDEGAIQTAFSTLLENAVKYSLPDSVISVELNRVRRNLILEVSNACQPDEQRDLSRLFDRFYRADTSRARNSGGSGVGLSIAKAIVEAHGGKISAFYRGSDHICFRISLPDK